MCTPDTRSGAGARRRVTCSPLSGRGFTVEDASLSARGSRLKGPCQKDAVCRCLALIPLASGCEGSAAAQQTGTLTGRSSVFGCEVNGVCLIVEWQQLREQSRRL